MTDVPDLVRVAVVAPIGNSDHSSLSAVISMAQAVPNLCVSRKVFLLKPMLIKIKFKSRKFSLCVSRKVFFIKSIGILSVVQYGNCLGVTFGFPTILLRF